MLYVSEHIIVHNNIEIKSHISNKSNKHAKPYSKLIGCSGEVTDGFFPKLTLNLIPTLLT